MSYNSVNLLYHTHVLRLNEKSKIELTFLLNTVID